MSVQNPNKSSNQGTLLLTFLPSPRLTRLRKKKSEEWGESTDSIKDRVKLFLNTVFPFLLVSFVLLLVREPVRRVGFKRNSHYVGSF